MDTAGTGPSSTQFAIRATKSRRRKRLSRWLRVVVALLGLAYVGAIGAVSFTTVKYVAPVVKSAVGEVQALSHTPIRSRDLASLLPGVPLYPNAKLNEATSNNPAFRLLKRTIGDESAEVLAFDCDDSLDRVLQWHRSNLKGKGWHALAGLDDLRLPFDLPVRAVAFVRRTQLLVILPGLGRGRFGRNGYLLYAKGMRPPVDLARLAREVGLHPRDVRLRRQLADAYESANDYRKTLEQWQALLSLIPDRGRTEFKIAHLLTRLRRNEEAVTWFRRAAEHSIATDRRVAMAMAGQTLVIMGRRQEAEELLVNALGARPMPGDAMVHLQLGMLYHTERRLDEAVAEYTAAQPPGQPGLRINLARAELERGHEERARTLLIETARRDRRYASPFLEELLSNGGGHKPRHPWAGLQYPTTVTAPWAHALHLPADAGVWLEEVVPGSPAARAGLRPQDVIFAVDGEPYTESLDLIQLIRSKHPGDELRLRVWRGAGPIDMRLRLGSILER